VAKQAKPLGVSQEPVLSPRTLSGSDLVNAMKSALQDALSAVNGELKQQYLDWVADVAPAMAAYATAAAAGDPTSAEVLEHLKGQAIGKAALLEIEAETAGQQAAANIAIAVAVTVAKFLL
jgi:hypothetical protein